MGSNYMYNINELTESQMLNHAVKLAITVSELIYDMIGIQLTVGEPSTTTQASTNFAPITVYTTFSGVVQGEYFFSVSEENAKHLLGVDSDEELTNDDYTSGFFEELLNCAVGIVIEDIKGTYAYLTFTSPRIVVGQIFFPEYNSSKVLLHDSSGEPYGECKFSINMAKIEITDKLMKTMASLRNKTEESNLDALTGLYNRAYYNYYVTKLFGLKQPITFAIIDIDNFKDINDGFGHSIGDEALKHLSNEFKKNGRENDIIIRYGGDEFVVLFENSKASEAIHFFERVSQNLKTTPLISSENSVVPITFSVGMAEHLQLELFEELFDRADKALYKAKESGRDMVIIVDKLPL